MLKSTQASIESPRGQKHHSVVWLSNLKNLKVSTAGSSRKLICTICHASLGTKQPPYKEVTSSF